MFKLIELLYVDPYSLESIEVDKESPLVKAVANELLMKIVGLLAYRVTGRTNTLFPSLNLIPVNFN